MKIIKFKARTALCGITIVTLLGCAYDQSGIYLATSLPDPLVAGWQGKAVCEQLTLTQTQRTLRCTFPPGVGHERHFHAPHFGYALSGGRMRLTDDSGVREVDLATDSYFTSQGTAWHEVLNVGTTTVEYLIVEPR